MLFPVSWGQRLKISSLLYNPAYYIMNKILLLCALNVAVAYAAPDSLSDLTDPVAATTEAATATSAPLAPPTTENPALNKSDQGTVEDRTKLVAKLFQDYDKNVNPDDVKVQFSLALIDFHVLEEKDALESHVLVRYVWHDARLKWDSEEYGGATVFRIGSDMVWKPDVTLFNSADPVHMMNCWQTNVLIYSSGKILWIPPCKLLSRCHLTLKKKPYGEQVCGLKFGSWTFGGNTLDLDFANENKTMELTNLSNTSGFEILSITADKTDKHYPCCLEPYRDLTYNLTIKRIPGEELIKKW